MSKPPSLYEVLEADPYSYQYRWDGTGQGRYVLRLDIDHEHVESYVDARITLARQDWWWVRAWDSKQRREYIELNVHAHAVLAWKRATAEAIL